MAIFFCGHLIWQRLRGRQYDRAAIHYRCSNSDRSEEYPSRRPNFDPHRFCHGLNQYSSHLERQRRLHEWHDYIYRCVHCADNGAESRKSHGNRDLASGHYKVGLLRRNRSGVRFRHSRFSATCYGNGLRLSHPTIHSLGHRQF